MGALDVDRGYEDLEDILKENWKEIRATNKSLNLPQIIDYAKLSRTTTKNLKQLMSSYSEENIALLLNLKIDISNRTAYKEYKSREKMKQTVSSKELKTMYLQKKSLMEERSTLINEIFLYKEYLSAEIYHQ
ncbi:hypothetical protein LOD99_4311 [Oopsacas minuta]|uniref:Uncharacterized protein n=1 Tax=Oopsacas minuta TaxID=111878 RepID=A0AAV7JWT0_9METZ|nr:hypothetical protein LOD99_4311 [Oopsacas minuta]